MIIRPYPFLVRALNTLMFLKLELKSRFAGAGSIDELRTNSGWMGTSVIYLHLKYSASYFSTIIYGFYEARSFCYIC